MGAVYRAIDTRLHRTVALKVIKSAQAGSAESRARFLAEAEAIAALAHPHICRLYDIGQQNDNDFLIMELLEGETRHPAPPRASQRAGRRRVHTWLGQRTGRSPSPRNRPPRRETRQT